MFFYAWEPASNAPATGLSQGPSGMVTVETPGAQGLTEAPPIDWNRYYRDPTYELPEYYQSENEEEDDISDEYAALAAPAGFAAQGFGPQATITTGACFSASGLGAGSGDVIRLTSNIGPVAGDCAAMDVTNVTLNCDGFTIRGSAGSDDAISISVPHVTVANCTVVDSGDDGITIFSNADDFNITNTTVRNSSSEGIFIDESDDGIIQNSFIINNSLEGIQIQSNSENITITGNTIANNSEEELLIFGSAGDDYIITNNLFEDETGSDIHLLEFNDNSNVDIIGNTFGNFSFVNGVAIESDDGSGAENLTITDNIFNNSLTTFLQGINTVNFNNSLIQNNSISPRGDIRVLEGNDVTVRDNTLNGTLSIQGSFGDRLTNTLVAANTWTDDRDNSTDSTIAINTRFATNYTVRDHANISMEVIAEGSNNATIINNTLYGNARITVNGNENTVRDNTWPTIDIFGPRSGGIYASFALIDTQTDIFNNTLTNGEMASIRVQHDNVRVENNTIINTTGNGVFSNAMNVSIKGNLLLNVSGAGITVNNTNITIHDNNITMNTDARNTTFNLAGVDAPPINGSGVGILLRGPTRNTTILRNNISVNSGSPLNDILGIVSVNELVTFNFTLFNARVENVTISNNKISRVGMGIHLLGGINSEISLNTLVDNNRRGLFVEDSTGMQIFNNTISTSSASSVGTFERGFELYRSRENTINFTTITGYHSGLYVYNSTFNNITNVTLSSQSGYGLFSFQSRNNTLAELDIASSVPIGVSLLRTNGSTINESNIESNLIGIELYQSFNNTIKDNAQDGGGTADYGFVFDLFSEGNTIDDNTFSGNTIADILFDMFATDNDGAGNGGPTTASENGATGNSIT